MTESAAAVRKHGRSLRVAVCVDTRDGPGRERLRGLYDYATPRAWRLFHLRTDEPSLLEQVVSGQVDGAVLYDRDPTVHRYLQRAGIPCVETGSRNLEFDDGAVHVDDGELTAHAVRHLTAAGFEHLAYCGYGPNAVSERRAREFTARAEADGRSAQVFADGQPSGGHALEPLIAWLRQLPRPTGVLAFDDKMAERVLAACRWADLRVPDDLGVLGIGNDELICELATPWLSSVALPTREIGRRAAEILEGILDGHRPAPIRLPLPPLEVISRASTERHVARHPAVARAVAYIRAEHHRPIGLKEIASALGVARRTLERRFAAEMNMTPHDFLVQTRLQRAKRLLRGPAPVVADVARECGYQCSSAFIRMFERQVGYSPEAFRRRMAAACPPGGTSVRAVPSAGGRRCRR
ncbi:substrate-binding domain-containing protein [Opitutus sp. ER46]|uniref:substrate-binding domain-containing protein n=1 Tax=Opitutus sp. ER46 TaxID=2161864 RepID=UPI001304F87E|nr:substrate-binding domain-containing protein [Opitutus sp. ER46]